MAGAFVRVHVSGMNVCVLGCTVHLCVFYQAYDQHLNMVLGDVEETITTVEIDEETFEEIVKTRTREARFLFVRGDGVIVVGCQARSC